MNISINYDKPKQDTLLYVTNSCFTEWKKYGKEPDSLRHCFTTTLLKTKIDSVTYTLQSYMDTTTFKKIGHHLFFKDNANPQYKLLFDFETLEGGYNIKRPYKDGMYKIVCSDKLKYKDKYLYGLNYEPIGFTTTEHRSIYYFDKDGECVMMLTGGFMKDYRLRLDYFERELSYDEKGNKYFE